VCGIFGIWHNNGGSVNLKLVPQALTTMRHRGPDDEGYILANTYTGRIVFCGGDDTDRRLELEPINLHFSEEFNLSFGFRRLSILDLSPAGHQPMSSADGRYWIVFNGEIYNYLELRAELQRYHYQFVTGTDTEVVLAAFDHWGIDCLPRFNGMWAFAVWDTQQGRLFCARDRFGMVPLSFHLKLRHSYVSCQLCPTFQ
jgi:asparagine synthase (glutamine-hydrolysing)